MTGTFNVNLAAVQRYLSAADFAALQQIDANETAINAARVAAGLAPLFGPAGPAGRAQAQSPASSSSASTAASPRPVRVTRSTSVTPSACSPASRVRLFGDFTYEAYYSYARTRNAQIQDRQHLGLGLIVRGRKRRINVSAPAPCRQEDVDGISILAQNGEVSVLQVASASVAGTVGNLGLGGDNVGLAVGAEYRKMKAEFIPDTALSSGDVIGFNAGDPTSGAYDVKEVFGELRVPIMADHSFVHRLELNGAARYSDYSLAAVGGVCTWRRRRMSPGPRHHLPRAVAAGGSRSERRRTLRRPCQRLPGRHRSLLEP